MKALNNTELLAHQQAHPKKPIIKWQVKHCGKVIYESDFVALCQHYINTNNLTNTKITAKR